MLFDVQNTQNYAERLRIKRVRERRCEGVLDNAKQRKFRRCYMILRGRYMKILLCSHEMSYTGAPRSLKLMAGVLKEAGYDVTVWSLREGSFKKEFEMEGFVVRTISFPEMVSDELAETIGQFSVVIANTIFCAAFAQYAGKYTKAILYVREAQNLPQLISDCNLNEIDLLNAEHIVCVSEYAKTFLEERYGIYNATVIHNFVEDVYAKKDCKYKNKKVVDFLVSGTLEPRKGQKIAVEALNLLPKFERKKMRLHLVGPMPEWATEYQSELCLNTENRLIYHGEIQEREILLELYKSMDVILIPSLDESCSLVALEAAMLGKAMLLTENVGAKYLVDCECIVKTKDSQNLSLKMLKCIKKPKLLREIGARNRQRYLELGTKEKYRESIERYLFHVLQ